MRIKIWFRNEQAELNGVVKVRINFSRAMMDSETALFPETIAIEQKDIGTCFRFTDIEEIEILKEKHLE